MKTEFLLEYTATLKPGVMVGATPSGVRNIVDVTGGSFEGPKLKGKVLHSGGDWVVLRDSGYGALDVRATFETDDGAFLYIQYYGLIHFTDQAAAVLESGGETQYGDHYFFINPRIETGDERYAWLNDIFCVAEGRLLTVDGGPAVQYRVFKLDHD